MIHYIHERVHHSKKFVPEELKNELCKVVGYDERNVDNKAFTERAKRAMIYKYLYERKYAKTRIAKAFRVDYNHVELGIMSFLTFKKYPDFMEIYNSLEQRLNNKEYATETLFNKEIAGYRLDFLLRAAGLQRVHIKDNSPLLNTVKRVLMYILVRHDLYTMKQVAEVFGITLSSVSKIMKVYDFLMKRDNILIAYKNYVLSKYQSKITSHGGFYVDCPDNN